MAAFGNAVGGAFMDRLRSFLFDERAATSIEYALIATLIFLVILSMVIAVGNEQVGLYSLLQDELVPALGG